MCLNIYTDINSALALTVISLLLLLVIFCWELVGEDNERGDVVVVLNQLYIKLPWNCCKRFENEMFFRYIYINIYIKFHFKF